MTDAYIRAGVTRSGFSLMYHELFDLYHPYIGDTATLIYLYLLRFRNNEDGNPDKGKAWRGRTSIEEKFRISSKTIPIINEILVASGLVHIETRPSGRGREKIFYYINDPLDRQQFREMEPVIIARLAKVLESQPGAFNLLGKEHREKLKLFHGKV